MTSRIEQRLVGLMSARLVLSLVIFGVAIGMDALDELFYWGDVILGPATKLVHIDPIPGRVGRSEPTDVGIIADPKVALAELASAVDATMSGSAKEAAKGRAVSVAEEKENQKAAWNKRVQDRWNIGPMSAERMIAELAGALPDDTIIVDPKVVTAFNEHHHAQMLGYLAITGLELALLLNFKYAKLQTKRVVKQL